MQSVGESLDQDPLSGEGRLGRGFLGGEFEGCGRVLETEKERAGVFEILGCNTISFSCPSGRAEEARKGEITADVLMRS